MAAAAEDTVANNENDCPNDSPPSMSNGTAAEPHQQATTAVDVAEFDDFGLPLKKYLPPGSDAQVVTPAEPDEEKPTRRRWSLRRRSTSRSERSQSIKRGRDSTSRASSGSRKASDIDEFEDAISKPVSETASAHADTIPEEPRTPLPPNHDAGPDGGPPKPAESTPEEPKKNLVKEHAHDTGDTESAGTAIRVSEFSHQQLTAHKEEKKDNDDSGWQTMPAYAPYDIYDDDNKLVAKEHNESDEEKYGYAGLGGAGKGYTRVLVDDDAESATSMDDNTQYLFNKATGGTSIIEDEEQQRDAVSQMQATKDLLTEGQRIAYVGVTRLELSAMTKEADVTVTKPTGKTKKQVQLAAESMKMWSQKMMIRLYAHMDISSAEQIMIEQLSEHGVEPKDLTPALMANARVNNPMADDAPPGSALSGEKSPRHSVSSAKAGDGDEARDEARDKDGVEDRDKDEDSAEPPPPYDTHNGDELAVQTPSQLPTTAKIDIDLRWTVLCDLFLVLIADSVYDARSRVLLERVGKSLGVAWVDICRFEKKVTDALEMQQNAQKENWNEDEHMDSRRKQALRRRYVVMGLATVGGGLVIGLSAGLLAPMIGAGLAAGFATIGVSGTSGFLAGAGGAAIITSGAAASGSVIGARAANRRTGAVKTFEYRPLHNNKRINLIVTVSGWMTGNVDDVRLPYSTVDPVMGDVYSVLWEPEMLSSMGDTINILATEVRSGHDRLLSLERVLETNNVSQGTHPGSSAAARQHYSSVPHGSSPAARGADKVVLSHRQPVGCLA